MPHKNVSGSSNSHTRGNYSVKAVFTDKNYSKRRDTHTEKLVYLRVTNTNFEPRKGSKPSTGLKNVKNGEKRVTLL